MLEQLIISIQIILIDIVMAADNAIIIGLIASGFAKENRKKIIAYGVAAAFIFRIIFAFGADFVLDFPIIKIIGGLLLLWIVYNLRQDFFGKNKVRSPLIKSKETLSFSTGVYRVLVADFTLSLDNILGVAGAAKDHYYLLIFGLVLSIVIMATAATLISKWIKKYKWIAWVGLIAILVVSIDLIYTDMKLFL